MGPYAFKQFYHRANTTFSDEEEEVVDFYKLKRWEFDPERSEGSLSDEIWSVNMILLSIAEAIRYSKKMENLCENSLKGGLMPGPRMTIHSCSIYLVKLSIRRGRNCS